MEDPGTLENREKVRIALAAAMGGGCRTCAEKLFALAGPAGSSSDELEQACVDGLLARDEATARMREKAESLLGRALGSSGRARPRERDIVTDLCRLAAAVSSNSAPDALRYGDDARARGASEAAIAAAIGIGKSVRSKAQGFSDGEVREARERAGETTAAEAPPEAPACCGPAGDAGAGGGCAVAS